MKRLFTTDVNAQESNDEEHAEHETEHEPDHEPRSLSVCDELNLEIQKSKYSTMQINGDNFNTLKKEFDIYEATGKKSKNKDLLYNALLTVKPTSTEFLH